MIETWRVTIPGITAPYSTWADSKRAAIRDAVYFHGLRVTPPGTNAARLPCLRREAREHIHAKTLRAAQCSSAI